MQRLFLCVLICFFFFFHFSEKIWLLGRPKLVDVCHLIAQLISLRDGALVSEERGEEDGGDWAGWGGQEGLTQEHIGNNLFNGGN